MEPHLLIGIGGPGVGGNPNLSVAMLQHIAGVGFTYSSNPIQNTAIDKTLAYRILKASPALIVGSPILTNFYNNAQPTGMLRNKASVLLECVK